MAAAQVIVEFPEDANNPCGSYMQLTKKSIILEEGQELSVGEKVQYAYRHWKTKQEQRWWGTIVCVSNKKSELDDKMKELDAKIVNARRERGLPDIPPLAESKSVLKRPRSDKDKMTIEEKEQAAKRVPLLTGDAGESFDSEGIDENSSISSSDDDDELLSALLHHEDDSEPKESTSTKSTNKLYEKAVVKRIRGVETTLKGLLKEQQNLRETFKDEFKTVHEEFRSLKEAVTQEINRVVSGVDRFARNATPSSTSKEPKDSTDAAASAHQPERTEEIRCNSPTNDDGDFWGQYNVSFDVAKQFYRKAKTVSALARRIAFATFSQSEEFEFHITDMKPGSSAAKKVEFIKNAVLALYKPKNEKEEQEIWYKCKEGINNLRAEKWRTLKPKPDGTVLYRYEFDAATMTGKSVLIEAGKTKANENAARARTPTAEDKAHSQQPRAPMRSLQETALPPVSDINKTPTQQNHQMYQAQSPTMAASSHGYTPNYQAAGYSHPQQQYHSNAGTPAAHYNNYQSSSMATTPNMYNNGAQSNYCLDVNQGRFE